MKRIDEWEWQQPPLPISGLLPPASGYHAACTCEGKMYVFGGISDGLLIANFSCLDLKTWAWSACVPIVKQREHFKKRRQNNYNYDVEEEEESSESGDLPALLSSDSESYSDSNAEAPVPGRRQGCSMIAHNGKVYILGGTSGRHCQGGGQDFRDLFVWDTRRQKWLDHEIPKCPVSGIGRRHASVLVGDRIFCFGGSAPSTNHTCVLNLTTKKWLTFDTKGHVPSPRVSQTAHLCHNTIFVFGGSVHHGSMNSRMLYLLHPDKPFDARDFEPEKGEQYENEEEDYGDDGDDDGDDFGWRQEANRFPRFQCAQQ
jgi:hypothetical protein